MARRANNEGNLRRRTDGRWELRLSLPDGSRRSFYGRTQADVRKLLSDYRAAVDAGKPIGDGRLTVGQYLDQWLASKGKQVRPATLRGYRAKAKHIKQAIGRKKLRTLSVADVEGMVADQLAAGMKPRSVAHHLAVLRNALTAAQRRGHVGQNVAKLVPAPHVPDRHVRAITTKDARVILDAVRGDRFEALYVVGLACGLRLSEALALQWGDVDVDRGELHVRRGIQRIAGAYEFVPLKTMRSRRTLPLPGPVAVALEAHRVRQRLERQAAGPLWEGEQWGELVFPHAMGGPQAPATVTRRLQRLTEDAGLGRLGYHQLRHGAASMMAAMNVPPRIAMELLGHADISTTMQIYSHVAEENQRAASSALAAAIWGAA